MLYVYTVRVHRNPKRPFKLVDQAAGIVDGDRDVEIQADQRFDVGVYCLPSDDAIGDLPAFEESQQASKQVGCVHRHQPPKSRSIHQVLATATLILRETQTRISAKRASTLGFAAILDS